MMFRKSLVGLNRRVRYSCAVYAQCSYTGYQNGSAIALCQHSRQIFPSYCGVRHTSGNPVVPPVITKAFEAATPASNETSVSSSIESLVQSIGPIPEAPLLPPPKVIELLSNGEPSISSLGLGGFSPVGIIQHILELVHVSTGLSWGWTIVIVAVSIRMLCFKLVVRQRQESKKFAANYPQTQFLQQKMTEARQQNDIIAMSKYSHEFREHIQNANSFGAMKYAFFNGGILISLTLALRGMCDLPVESFRTGGFEFIPDLTMSDPTCILPAINGTLLYLHFLFSKDLNNMLPNLSPLALQGIMVALGTSLGLFSLKFQGAIVMYWISSQCVTVLQYHYLNRPSVLKKYGLDKAGQTSKIAELMKADKAKRGLRKLGFIAQFKETQANARLAEEVKRRSHLDSAAFERAGREPIRKVYNYDITKVKKM